MFDTLTDAELSAMTDRAYREASRSWADWRAADAGRGYSDDARAIAQMLHDAAWEAENFWRSLYDEVKRRERIAESIPQSPFVRRALANELPAKETVTR